MLYEGMTGFQDETSYHFLYIATAFIQLEDHHPPPPDTRLSEAWNDGVGLLLLSIASLSSVARD